MILLHADHLARSTARSGYWSAAGRLLRGPAITDIKHPRLRDRLNL